MQRAETTCALVLLVLAALVAREAIRLEIGWGDIGPKGGFFPFWLAVLLGLSSLTTITKSFLRREKTEPNPFLPRERLGLLLTVLVPIALVVPLIAMVGFYLTGFLYLSLYIWWTGKKHWAVNGSISILFPAAIYLIFEKWFLIPLPKGMFEPYLPF
jgi:putative tricarboxylic transport membrane protein